MVPHKLTTTAHYTTLPTTDCYTAGGVDEQKAEEQEEEGKRKLQNYSRGGIPLSYLPAILCASDILSYLGSGVAQTSLVTPGYCRPGLQAAAFWACCRAQRSVQNSCG